MANGFDFRRKRNIYAWCGFLFSQFSEIKIKVFNKNPLYPIKDIDLKSSVKNILPPILFYKVMGV